MQSRTNALKRTKRSSSKSTRSGIKWEFYDDGHHLAYVRGKEGAYELTAMEHPAFMDGKGYAVFVERAQDNSSSSQFGERIDEARGPKSDMGRDPEGFVKAKAKELFLRNDVFVGNITQKEYSRWNELHPGREGYRSSDWVIYARPKGSKSVFMPFTPYGNTTRKDDTLHAMRVGPEHEDSVRRFLDKNADDPNWEFEARSGPEGPKEKRLRAEVKPVSKSTRSGSAKGKLAWDMVELAYDLDPHEFMDQYGSKEEFYEENMRMLSTKKGIDELISFYDSEPIDFDSGLDARRKDVLKRLRTMSGASTSKRGSTATKPKAKGKGARK